MFRTKVDEDVLMLQAQIDSVRAELREFKKDIAESIKDLCEANGERFDCNEATIAKLVDACRKLDDYDDLNRSRIRAICDHLGVQLQKVSSREYHEAIELEEEITV